MTRDNHTGMVKFYGLKSFGNILVKTSKSCQDPAEARFPLGLNISLFTRLRALHAILV